MFSFISYAQEDNYINKQVKKSYFGLYSGPVFFKEKYFYHEVSLNNNSLFDRFNYGFDAGCYYITHIFDSDFYVQMEANYSYMKYELNYYDWSKVPGQFSYIDSVNYMIYSSCIRFAFIPTYKISDKKNIFIRIGPFMNFTLKNDIKGTIISNSDIQTTVADTTSPYGYIIINTHKRTVYENNEIRTTNKPTYGLLFGFLYSFPIKENIFGIEWRTYYKRNNGTFAFALYLTYQFK